MPDFPIFPHYASLTVGGGYWLSLSERQRSTTFLAHVHEAFLILANHGFDLPDNLSLESVVEASFEAYHFYVSNGIEQADPDDWHVFFERFVVTCYLQSCKLDSNEYSTEIVSVDHPEGFHAAAD